MVTGIPPQGTQLLGDKQGHQPLGMEQQPAAGQWGRGPGLEAVGTVAGLGGTPAPGGSKVAAAAAAAAAAAGVEGKGQMEEDLAILQWGLAVSAAP